MRARLALLAVTFLLAAGCVQPARQVDVTSTTTPPAPAALDALAAPTLRPDLDLGPGDGEPNIAVAPDGTIYITPVSNLYRSTDGGKTFKDLGTSKTDGHGDGDIAVDATGRLHWLGLFGASTAIPYQHSDNQGDKFTTAVDLSQASLKGKGTGADREWIDAAPDGSLGASWRDSSGNGIIAFRHSPDDGATWGPIQTMAPDAVGGNLVHGVQAHSWYEAMTTFESGTGTMDDQVVLARSHDDGAHWNTTTVAVPVQSAQSGLVGFATSIFPVTAIDGNGTIYVAFSMDQRFLPQAAPKPAARFGVFLAVSKDDGATFSTPILVSNPDHAAVMPALAAGAAGRVALAWYENQHGVPNDVAPDLWDVMLWESVTADTQAPASIVAKLNGDANHIGSVCTNGLGCVAGGDRCLLDYFEVVLDGHGLPLVTWASCSAGTGIGVAAVATHVHFGGVAGGTPLQTPAATAPSGTGPKA